MPGCRGCTGKRGCPSTPGQCSSSWHPAPHVSHPWLQDRDTGRYGVATSSLPRAGTPGRDILAEPQPSLLPGLCKSTQPNLLFNLCVCPVAVPGDTQRAHPGLEVAPCWVWGSLHLPLGAQALGAAPVCKYQKHNLVCHSYPFSWVFWCQSETQAAVQDIRTEGGKRPQEALGTSLTSAS